MSIIVIAAVVGGIFTGYIFFTPEQAALFDRLSRLALMFLLFCIGIDIGRHRRVLDELKTLGFKLLLIPLAIIIGSIFTTAVIGYVLGLPVNEAAAVGAGFGWYSLSGALLSQIYDARTGALAFLTNVMRELIAFLIIPFTAKYIGKHEAIAPGGATTMDTTLPIISKTAGSEITLIAFINGVVLTFLVPVLVTLLIKLPF